MNKLSLTKQHVFDLVSANRYKVNEVNKFLSRCVDGRYRSSKDLSPLAFPGADAGELALVLATANSYGLEVDTEKVYKTVIDLVGGIDNFNFHSDHHGDTKIPASGCGHMKQIHIDPQSYHLKKEQVKTVDQILLQAKSQGAKETVLTGEHLEGAVLQIIGQESVSPRFISDIEGVNQEIEVFVFHETLVKERHRILAQKLLENDAVKLSPGTDSEYLYDALSEMTDNHLFETLKRLAVGLPIFQAVFDTDGTFNLAELEKVPLPRDENQTEPDENTAN